MTSNLPKVMFIKSEQMFLSKIDNNIKNILKELPEKYFETLQIINGNRFRALLTYYGYTLYSTDLNEQLYETATAIELIHKASIIIDDIIDNDDKRHGFATVHMQFSTNEALILTIFLLGKCIELLGDIDDVIVKSFGSMILKMCNGTLNELNMEENVTIDKINNIINDQTSQVIKNSLVMGMKSYNPGLNNQNLEIIGIKLGYFFQLLNDCEPYFNTIFLKEYKGNRNFDINKHRKNICFSYLKQFVSNVEYKAILTGDYQNINILMKKYKIQDYINEELNLIELDILDKLKNLSNEFNVNRLEYFIKYSISLAKSRANFLRV